MARAADAVRGLRRLVAGAALLLATPAAAEPINLFAASSTANALAEAVTVFEQRDGSAVRLSFAASSTLARQIANGAPAHLFLSADQPWIDYLLRRDALETASVRPLLGNRLVLIAPRQSRLALSLRAGMAGDALATALQGRLVIGEPSHVPAGRYARAALETLGQWTALADRLAYAQSARAVLALVARGEGAAGLVYRTDATVEPRVRVVADVPAWSHPPVVYPLALVNGPVPPGARRLHAFLFSAAATAVFREHGFAAPVPRPS